MTVYSMNVMSIKRVLGQQIYRFAGFLLLISTQVAWSAETASISPTGSILKMLLGLGVVLAVMAAIAWGMKRLMPNGMGHASVAKVVGGVSVGARERVVVVEVAGRWIVVGVAPGQVNALANFEAGGLGAESLVSADAVTNANQPLNQLVEPFANWLKTSSDKLKSK